MSIVVATYNERDNVRELVARLHRALVGRCVWEVVFVDDDSPDGTADEVRRLALRDPRVRLLRRIGRRGLSSACVEGMLASVAPYLAVLDRDPQHDERLLPAMLERLRRREAELVVGSRYASGGGTGDWSGRRLRISRIATRLIVALLRVRIADPMSGFFMLRRTLLEERVRRLSGAGFKLLFDVLTCAARPVRVVELPYDFRSRMAGVSKLEVSVAWKFLVVLAARASGRLLPTRFVAFASVGVVGVAVHVTVFACLYTALASPFMSAQETATGAAIACNYALNNVLTFSDRRLRGVSCGPGWPGSPWFARSGR